MAAPSALVGETCCAPMAHACVRIYMLDDVFVLPAQRCSYQWNTDHFNTSRS